MSLSLFFYRDLIVSPLFEISKVFERLSGYGTEAEIPISACAGGTHLPLSQVPGHTQSRVIYTCVEP